MESGGFRRRTGSSSAMPECSSDDFILFNAKLDVTTEKKAKPTQDCS